MSVELVQFMSQLLNLVMFIQILTHVKFAEYKAVDNERTFLFLLSLNVSLYRCMFPFSLWENVVYISVQFSTCIDYTLSHGAMVLKWFAPGSIETGWR